MVDSQERPKAHATNTICSHSAVMLKQDVVKLSRACLMFNSRKCKADHSFILLMMASGAPLAVMMRLPPSSSNHHRSAA